MHPLPTPAPAPALPLVSRADEFTNNSREIKRNACRHALARCCHVGLEVSIKWILWPGDGPNGLMLCVHAHYRVGSQQDNWKCEGLRAVGQLLQLGKLVDVFAVQAEQVEDINEALAVGAGWCFELDLGLGAPGNTKASGMKHEQIVCAVADSNCLGDGDVVLRRDRVEESALLGGVDDGLGFDQFSGQGLGGRVDLKLYGFSRRGWDK